MTPPPFDVWIVVALGVSAAIAIFLPVILAIVVRRRTGAAWRYLLIGAAVFVVSQLVLRLPWQIPVGIWLQKTWGTTGVMLGWGIFSAVTAALFEETGRYIAFRKWTPEQSLRSGWMYGVGHGGIESILLVGLTVVGTIVGYTLFTHGALPVPPEQMEEVAKQFTTLTPLNSLAGGFERIAAIFGHIGMSLLVLRSVAAKRPGYYWLSMGLHVLFGLSAILVGRIGLWPTEALIAVIGAVTLWAGLRVWRESPVARSS